jgi:DNA repair exonuclease SbcCD ATPase subunit
MYLYIKGFRTIQQYECEFQSECITLISGPSGVGKTTLMNAIFWCLYGTLKNVRKFGTKTGTCMVKIDLGNIKITRSKSPESLLVEEMTSEGVTSYKDDEGQARIVNLFGSSMIWLSSCYLSQGTRNKFLESPPSERLSLLSELCFSNHSPEEYLDKIEEKMKEFTKEFERENDFYKRDLDLFQKKRKEYPKYKDDLLTQEQKELLQEQLTSQELSMLEEELSISEKIESAHQSLLETRNQLCVKSPNYKEFILSIDQKNELISTSYSPYPSTERKLSYLENEIQELERKRVLLRSYLEQYNLKISEHLSDYQQYLHPKDTLDHMVHMVQTFPEEIGKMEKKWRELSHHQTNKNTWIKELDEMKDELNKIPNDLEVFLEDLSIKIQISKQYLEIKKKREELESSLKEYEDILSIDVTSRKIENEEITDSMVKEKRIEERLLVLTKMGIQDHKDAVQKAIDIRNRVLEVQGLWTFVDELQTLEQRINILEEQISNLKSSVKGKWISEKDLPEKIFELNSLRETLICPKCSVHLRFESNHLIECSNGSITPNVDLLSKWIEESKKRLDWVREKQGLEDQMNDKMIEFETHCKKLNITQDGLYDFPRLEESEKQNLYQETLVLEKVLDSYSIVLIPSSLLIQMNRKWESSRILDHLKNLEQPNPIASTLVLEKLEEQKEECVRQLSIRNHISQRMDQLLLKLEQANRFLSECSLEEIETLIEEKKKTYNDFREKIEKHKKSKEILDLEGKIESLGGSLDTLDKEILKLRDRLEQEWKKVEEERKKIEDAKEKLKYVENAETINEMDKRLSKMKWEDPKEIKNKILKCKSELEESKSKLLKCEKAEELSFEKTRLENQRSQVIHLSNRVSYISSMKMIANELEHKRMVSILDTINDFANEILTILFDEPIKIEFMVYKKSKTNDKIKPSIVYKLLYKGYEMDHVDQLSGGEGDRVSLAVTCALFHFSKFPFLLLDEFASSLDLNTKEMAIKSLKTFLGIGSNQTDFNNDIPIESRSTHSKGILCISHDTVEGIYDCMIPLNGHRST